MSGARALVTMVLLWSVWSVSTEREEGRTPLYPRTDWAGSQGKSGQDTLGHILSILSSLTVLTN